MKKKWIAILFVCSHGCGGTARKPDIYRADTEKLLATRNDQLKSCYEAALKADPKLAGTVKVQFVIEKKTGVVKTPQVAPASTAPAPLGQCVVQALEGLKLEPADRKEGRATFEYAFQPTVPK